ncbi:probable Sister chromatid cohesion protein PDS5 [Zygosaccharomyces bailii ISA1307]|uniref:ZYBA0S05-05600g1_1 n=1 Tax=Zygosaccharomyces bailii (strain CLIB 213 / ATCC 58445 / CBS 680 / BCRC 21525 / NBRC 1098 / NCYC 1416 / NRRL Y-2227) TaxID=1333698 RepID=A0A8J2X902_ZYGB2|nr:ZYBA0S05-05600g1_1 [Zygosaccharomyces bailii CLIB 213]CDH17712.1 probable Sister chromatid cohesion protein PDS5 [Zygosaccharomyces bailii ISA1307]
MTGSSKAKLKSYKPIISTSENIISTDELLERLLALHEELSTLPQGCVDLKKLEPYRTDLVDRKLLKHKDKGVRAFVACCLSDILRLYAPDAPYTDVKLTDIFKLFLAQFEQLGDPDNGYYIQQKYLITRLLEYRSIVLLTDLPSAHKLLERLFQIFYDDSKNFQPRMFKVIGGILGEVISEFESLPMDVLRLIFNKFLTYNPDELPKGLGVVSNCGYEISLILCETYSTRMSRHLTKYYSEILYNITSEEEQSFGARNELLKTIGKLHKLICRLWSCVPDLVSSVIGFVYHELLSDNELLRKASTELVSHLLTVDSDLNFATTHQDIYNTWLSKIADISAEVRQKWVEGLPPIINARDDISLELSKGLAKTLIDSDPRVRKSSVLVMKQLPVSILWKRVTDKTVYSCLLQLTREKNREVRELSIATVSKFYSESLNHNDRTTSNKDLWAIVKSIPSVLFNLYYINDLHINEQVDGTIFEYLLPLEVDDTIRVKRLLTVISHFNDKAFASFFAFNKRQLQMAIALSKYIEFCEVLHLNEKKDAEKEVFYKLKKTADWLACGMADQIKAVAALDVLKDLNDKRVYCLIKTCVSSDVPFAKLKNSMKELMNKLQDPTILRKSDVKASSTIIPRDLSRQIKILLYRASPINYNVSNIPILLDTGGPSSLEEVELKRELLDHILTVNPALFKDQIRTLKDMIIQDQDFPVAERGALTLDESFKTLYKICKTTKEQLDFDNVLFTTRLKNFVLEGKPNLAKYATKLFALSPYAEETLSNMKNCILPLDLEKDKYFASHIVVLKEIFRFSPHVLDHDSTEIVSYLIKEVLLANQVVGDSDDAVDWVEDGLLNETKYFALASKVFSLQLFTVKLKSIACDVTNDELSKAFTEKTVKLFFYLIASGGELISEHNKEYYPTPSNYQTKLRCCAGIQLLKLAQVPHLNEFIKSSDIIKMINLVEDESLPVRRSFLDQLKSCLANELISIKFLPLVFFTAYEPQGELKTATKTWINFTFNKDSFKKGTFFERALPRLIHAIAHHPDIVEGLDLEGEAYMNVLTTAIEYLIFYFDSIATQENFSLLYYLSERVKNYQDRTAIEDIDDEEHSANEKQPISNPSTKMYIIGELAQMILLTLKEKKGWQHSAYPGKLNLPADLFMPYSNTREAQASFKTYLPDAQADKLRVNIVSKVGRIAHTSQTQRQNAQKRMLANEYESMTTRRNKKLKTGRRRIKTSDDETPEEGEEDEDAYSPSKKMKDKGTGDKIARRSARARKTIDYKEEGSGSEENF